MPCPTGVPQALCDAAGNLLANQGLNPQGWDGGNVAATILDWYNTLQKTSPTPVPAMPSTLAGMFSDPFMMGLLNSALAYWNNVAYRNPGIAGKINPQAWAFPWQYVSPQAADWSQAAATALQSMLGDPNALATLLGGKLPAFDPSRMNWMQFGSMPVANDPNTFANTANGIAQLQPAMQDFLARADKCGLLKRSAVEIQKAWADFIAFGVEPCAALQPPKPLPQPPTPAPTPAPVPQPAAKTESSNTGLIVIGAIAAGAVGVLAYMMAKKRPSAPAMEGCSECAAEGTGLPRKYDYDTWRARVVAIARDKHGVPTDWGFAILDAKFAGSEHGRLVRGRAWFEDGKSTHDAARGVNVLYKRRDRFFVRV